MGNWDLYPDSVVARFCGLIDGQSGLFFDDKLKVLIVGKILNYKLHGRVIHNGLTSKDYEQGRYFSAAWSVGYSYKDWDKHEMKYVGRLWNYTSLCGYLEYIDKEDIIGIKRYFKVKELLLDGKLI